jgi:N-acyl-D-amino-acid deacylase
MRRRIVRVLAALTAAIAVTGAGIRPQSQSILIQNGTLVDGAGKARRKADVRIRDGRIVQVGDLQPSSNERVLEAEGLVVAPGFIDAHSHTDGAIEESPLLESQIRQGITTAVVGQDGGSSLPISDFFAKVAKAQPAINFATFAGHGTIRRKVMGDDFKRAATDVEVQKMAALLEQAMREGALGLSTGLEYENGLPATPFEVIALAKVAARHGGMYISHTRSDGGGSNMQSLEELKAIAREAKIPAQNSHIKLAVPEVWGHAKAVRQWIAQARRQGLDITADVYPYTFWQSTITVLMPEHSWASAEAWADALQDIGGPDKILLTRYTPNPAWQGKDLAQIAAETGKSPAEVAVEIIQKTHFPGSKESESIICRAMAEDDLVEFVKDPNIMFCSDGSHGGSHPRGAGSFPRILGRYVRELKAISLEEAIRKATSFPARRFGFKDRGKIQPGMKADVVVFDAAKIQDRADTSNPRAFSEGMVHVIVNGVPVLEHGKMTGARPGIAIRKEPR